MIYASLFACALALGWLAAYRLGGAAERETMCILSTVWAGTMIAYFVTSDPVPLEFYAPLDFLAICWLLYHQRRNWQWIPTGIFTVMLLLHFMQWSGYQSGLLDGSPRPYKDFLAILAYAQVAATGWASYERGRERSKLDPVMGRWFLAGNWVPFSRNYDGDHARSVR